MIKVINKDKGNIQLYFSRSVTLNYFRNRRYDNYIFLAGLITIIEFLFQALQSVLTSEKSVSEIPEAMDDFFCNFLVRLGMSRTLDCFQTEW